MPHGYGAISFPGLGIYDLEINRVAFSVFGKDIYWYGIIIATGFFLGVMLAAGLAKRSGIDPDRIIDLTLIATPVAIIGARAYYVLTTLGEYDSFYEVIAIWNGGIAIYGAIIAGLAVILIYCRVKKLPLMRVLDCLAPAVILGQAIGRWGNFINQEAFGEVCDLPWADGACHWRRGDGCPPDFFVRVAVERGGICSAAYHLPWQEAGWTSILELHGMVRLRALFY